MAIEKRTSATGATATPDSAHSVDVLYSMVDPKWVARLVADEYDVGVPDDCRLLFAGHNDTYEVSVGDRRYAFRLHTRGKWWLRGEGDARFELDLLTHLHSHGVPVSYPMPRRNGDLLGTIPAPEGERFYSLFSWAPGAPPGKPTVDQAYVIGRTLAAIHVTADLHTPRHPRYHLDEAAKLDRPLAELDEAIRGASPEDEETIRHHAAEIRANLASFDPGPTGWGIIHADIQPHNYHFDAGGRGGDITVFDFDLCGYGWRAYDLAYCYTRTGEPQRSAMLDGYQSVRTLSDAERSMLTTFGRLAWIAHDGRPVARLAQLMRDPYYAGSL
ncbi:homoserine kinase [Actinopolymorpha cephalotaxi]|uniref:Ser/Thr protein kinase RdoA (MazF antagonist) n=2 Tax=Actinopolymorpha cephalotaxi TaxID=504797 RepID=A0ABX2S7G9_9ACTN|nr:homoserine kinase [Actinopolymorpha cephalotaxi]NYH85226.1 Ser/Thr protein kinase RdoA (MazF antagonist) [Actinopolymorpha cephalotaxi]